MGLTRLHVLLTLLINSPVEVRGPLFILPLPAQWALDIVLGKHLLPVLGNTGHAGMIREAEKMKLDNIYPRTPRCVLPELDLTLSLW